MKSTMAFIENITHKVKPKIKIKSIQQDEINTTNKLRIVADLSHTDDLSRHDIAPKERVKHVNKMSSVTTAEFVDEDSENSDSPKIEDENDEWVHHNLGCSDNLTVELKDETTVDSSTCELVDKILFDEISTETGISSTYPIEETSEIFRSTNEIPEGTPTNLMEMKDRYKTYNDKNFQSFFQRASLLVERNLGADNIKRREVKKDDRHLHLQQRYSIYKNKDRPVVDLHWSKFHKDLFLTCYGPNPVVNKQETHEQGLVNVWNIVLHNRPEFTFFFNVLYYKLVFIQLIIKKLWVPQWQVRLLYGI
eukprot:UN33191